MFILSQDKTQIFNMEKMENIYICANTPGNCIKISMIGGTTRAGELGKYESYTKSKMAMEYLSKQIELGRSAIIRMPTDGEIVLNEKEYLHHATGKKDERLWWFVRKRNRGIKMSSTFST